MTGPGAHPKRFFERAAVREEPDGHWQITLDGKTANTPGRNTLYAPSEALARLIAKEWEAQGETVRPETMPLTRLANTAIDRTSFHKPLAVDAITAYAGHDLLCYRASEPKELLKKEVEAWDPYLAWAAQRFGLVLSTTTGVIHVEQGRESLAHLKRMLKALSPFLLTALHHATTLTGSVVLALALAEGWKPKDEIWKAAHIDEDHQQKVWGRVREAEVVREAKDDLWRATADFIGALGERPSSGLARK